MNPKKLLDDIRLLCRGKTKPVKEVYTKFNEETDDGRNMTKISVLLNDAIHSIIDVKEKSDIDSLFSAGGTSALMSEVSGLDESVLRQIDKEIPYHILFLLEYDSKYQAWIGYKEAAVSGANAFQVRGYYHTKWLAEDELNLRIEGFDMDAVYENFIRQIAGDRLQLIQGETLEGAVAQRYRLKD